MTTETTEKRETPFGPFRLLAGRHHEGGITYNRGDVFKSASDLLKHNRGHRKFELLAETPQVQQTAPTSTLTSEPTDELSGRTVAELRAMAEEDEIDLGGATKKEDILRIIREAYNG